MDEPSPVEEAVRLGVLSRLQSKPCTLVELSSTLGISDRAISSLMGRLASHGMVEEVPGSSSSAPAPAYRLVQPAAGSGQQARRGSRRNGGVQPKVGRMGGQTGMNHQMAAHSPPHGFMPAGMHMPYAYTYGQQVVYYPAASGMTPYQQPPMGPGGPPWHQRPVGMPGGGAAGGARMQGMAAQQQPGGSGGGMPLAPPGMAGYALPPGYYYAGAPPMAPLTPAVSASQQRMPPMARAGSSGGASSSSTGWGGVPLSHSAAEMMVGAQPSPRSQQQQQAAAPSGAQEAGDVHAAAAVAAGGLPAPAEQQQQQPTAGESETDGVGESVSQAGPTSSSSDGEEASDGGSGSALDQQQHPTSAAAGSSAAGRRNGSGGAGGGAASGGSSSGASSGGSRRSRGSRERQPCAFFLKTGTCAYGDSCKFAHPVDKAPKVEFNSLGLPLRPGEPECSFYVKNYRCAFGHTCKFHHPEMQAPPAVHLYPVQYQIQYPAGSSPVLNSVLGLGGPKPPGGPPGMAGMAGPGGAAPAFYVTTPHFSGGVHPGFHSQPPAGFPAMPSMGAAPAARGPPRRASPSRGGRQVAAAPPLPLAAAQAPEPQAAAAPPGAGQGAEPGAAAAEPSGVVPAAAGVPAPIMVFNSQQQTAQHLASALEQLKLPETAQQVPAQPEAGEGRAGSQGTADDKRAPEGSGGTGSSGLPGTLPHRPQQRADVLAVA